MKNVLLIALVLFAGLASANELQEKKAEYYASEAVKYFKLDESQKEVIYEAKLDLIKAQRKMYLMTKDGELSAEDEPSYRKENVYPFSAKIMKEIGIKWKELDKFNKKVHPTMNKLRL